MIHGDCLIEMKQIPDGSVDVVLADPPYGVQVADWDDDIPPQEYLDECLRVSAGPVLWFGAASVRVLSRVFEYNPMPERVIVWHVKFTLSKTSKNGMFYRWHPIFCWNLPKKTALGMDVISECTEAKRNWFYHPGAKPLKLMETLVRGIGAQTILDPFMGLSLIHI